MLKHLPLTTVWKGDITPLRVDAIVTTFLPGLKYDTPNKVPASGLSLFA